MTDLLAAGGATPRHGRPATSPRRGVFAVTAVGGLLVSLDVSVANALMPAIGADFRGDGRAAVSWVITAYAIVFAATLVPAGRIADRAGRRRAYVGGLAVFAVGSVICGFAPSLPVLVGGRAVQGLGAAAASPASLGLLLAAVAAAAPRVLPETPRHPGRRLPDPVGALVLMLSAAAVTLGLSEASEWGVLSARTVGSIAAGAALAIVFVRRSARVVEPLLDLALLRRRRVAVAGAVSVLYAAGLFSILLSFMLFFLDRWGLDLVRAGAAVVPMGLVAVLLTTRVGRLADRVGYRTPITAGASLMAVGLVLSAAGLSGDHFAARWVALAVLLGVGVGLCYPLLAAAAVHGLDQTDLAAASALNLSGRQLGAALGVAMSVGVLGPSATPSLVHFHTVWLVAAGFCAVAAAVATLLPAGRSNLPRTGSVLTSTPPDKEFLP